MRTIIALLLTVAGAQGAVTLHNYSATNVVVESTGLFLEIPRAVSLDLSAIVPEALLGASFTVHAPGVAGVTVTLPDQTNDCVILCQGAAGALDVQAFSPPSHLTHHLMWFLAGLGFCTTLGIGVWGMKIVKSGTEG